MVYEGDRVSLHYARNTKIQENMHVAIRGFHKEFMSAGKRIYHRPSTHEDYQDKVFNVKLGPLDGNQCQDGSYHITEAQTMLKLAMSKDVPAMIPQDIW